MSRASAMVACPEPLAAEVGASILERGGNAVDAGVATAFAQCVANPLLSSLGGCGQFLVYRSDRGHAEIVKASPMSGSGAVPGAYTPLSGEVVPGIVGGSRKVADDRNVRGHSASTIPTLVRGLEEVHRRHGRLPWQHLVEPSARLAAQGFVVTPYIHRTWDPSRTHPMDVHPADKIAANQAARAIFMPDGRLLNIGETLVQRDLARTLARIATEGASVFYDGEIGAIIGADFEANGGLVTLDDLRWARPWVDQAGRGRYRALELLTDDPPGLGVILLLIMRILEGIDLQSLGWNSPAYVDVVSRAMQFAFSDTGDLVAQGRSAAEILDPLRVGSLRARVENGEFPTGVTASSGSGTTHLAVIDRDRNVVSWVHSSGSGSGVVTPGLGFVHNDHMIMFDPTPGRPSSLAPRTVPVHGGGPVIILRDGRPLMAIGSPAGALKTTAITQVLLGVFEFGLPLQAAVSSPRVHTQQPGVIMVEPSYPSGLAHALARIGHRIVVSDYTARISAIMVTDDGDLVGGADPRGGGGLEWNSR